MWPCASLKDFLSFSFIIYKTKIIINLSVYILGYKLRKRRCPEWAGLASWENLSRPCVLDAAVPLLFLVTETWYCSLFLVLVQRSSTPVCVNRSSSRCGAAELQLLWGLIMFDPSENSWTPRGSINATAFYWLMKRSFPSYFRTVFRPPPLSVYI